MKKLLSIILMISLPKTTVQTGEEAVNQGENIDNVCLTDKNFTKENKSVIGTQLMDFYFEETGESIENENSEDLKKIDFRGGNTLTVKKVELFRSDFDSNGLYEELTNLQMLNNTEGFSNFFGCSYSKTQKIIKNQVCFEKYKIHILTENFETNLQKSGSDFKNSLKKSERLTHYKSLFSTINTLHTNSFAHQNIKPSTISPRGEITAKNDFSLTFTNFKFMRKFGTPLDGGTKIFQPPSFSSDFSQSTFQRDIFAILLTIVCLEYGQEFVVVDSRCYADKGYDTACFGDLLDLVYLGFLKREKGHQKGGLSV